MNAFVSTILRRSCPAVFAVLTVAGSMTAVARADDPAPVSPEANAAASAAAKPAAASTTDDKWRFVWHNNQWWYYKPNGTWMIHDGTAWHPQESAPPAAQVYQPAPNYRYRNSQPQSGYRQFMGSGRNGGGMANDGFWGNSPRYWTYQHVLK